MATVFERLNYNFDDTKYGSAIYLSDGAKKYLNAYPSYLSTWQEDDIANDDVSRSRYFKNPHDGVITIMINTASNIAAYANTANLSSLANTANSFIVELGKFKSHTDNVSGVTEVTGEATDVNIPMFDTALGIGTQILQITNKTDDIANSTPMLGSMTSLFIGDELDANSTILINDYHLLVNAATTEATVLAHINTANSMINTRRLHDWTFYQNSRQILSDYVFVTKFSNMGNTQAHLVNNLIGTDTLVTNLNSE